MTDRASIPVLLMTLASQLLLTLPVAAPAGAQSAALVGDWQGVLRVPGAELRIVFHITAAPGGELGATLDSPDQGAFGIPVTGVEVASDSVVLRVGAVNGVYRGLVRNDTMTGQWSQGGMDFPLTLTPAAGGTGPARPQEPAPPFPYEVREVTFENPEAGIRLAGTLTAPRGEGPFPAAVLISGSGPQDRDESLMGHRPFLVLADHLTRQGIAVLRFDDRGVGDSEGDFASATTADLAADVAAAVRWLDSLPLADSHALGLIGHSEGGIIAPMVAGSDPRVDWLVLLAPPGVPGDSLLQLQVARIAVASGVDPATIDRRLEQQRAIQEIVRESADPADAARRVRQVVRESIEAMPPAERAGTGLDDPATVDSLVTRSARQVLSPWFRYFLDHDPRPALRTLRVPTLALLGDRDVQVPAEENAPALRAALSESSAPHEVRVLPGLNHLFQHADTGLPAEYGRIEETMAPEALDAIALWIRTTAEGLRP
jgi:pimeloyl-ACP methyl ester carboxylesterase